MFAWLLLLFILVPLIELAILIQVGSYIGLWPTIALVIITGIIGATLARVQGFSILEKIRYDLSQGILPREEILDGLLVFAGGVVLLTPGILTDLWGFAMLVPLTRRWFKRWLRKIFDRMIQQQHMHLTYSNGYYGPKE